MLPFTTYNIPELPKKETSPARKWLWIITQRNISVTEEALLQKIILALKADSEADVWRIYVDDTEKISLSSREAGSAKLVIGFDIEPSRFGWWIDIKGRGMRFLEKTVYIQTTTLQELEESPLAKKQLWSAMQSFLEMK